MNMEKRLYTAKETCKLFSISRVTLHEWSKRGLLEKISIPNRRRIFISGQSVERLINQQPK